MKGILTLSLGLLLQVSVLAQNSTQALIEKSVDTNYNKIECLYKHLHEHPELSLQEKETAKTLAESLKALNFEVTENIGGHGLFGVFKNGEGPTLLVRADMDALPLEEKTGLPYASKKKGINAAGNETYVMHACGHDVHMSVFIGTATTLVDMRAHWQGTLVFVAQPAEENGLGADSMFKDGLYDKIPKPDYALALHDNAYLPAGTIGYREGPMMASVDMMDITVHGEGGHGAAPHTTIDPIVLSAQMINAFQTIVSRQIDPIAPAVVTVGSIHGGTVHNIIPDQVKMQLTLRSYSEEVREQTIASIKRICINLAEAAGLSDDKMPEFSIRDPQTPATVNDTDLTRRMVSLFKNTFGEDKVVETDPYMVGEDFSRFGMQAHKVPIFMFWLGAVDPELVAEAKAEGKSLPSLHSPMFAPLPEPTIKTGTRAMTTAVLDLMNKN